MTIKDKSVVIVMIGGILLLLTCIIALEIWHERILIHIVFALSLIVLGTIIMFYPESEVDTSTFKRVFAPKTEKRMEEVTNMYCEKCEIKLRIRHGTEIYCPYCDVHNPYELYVKGDESEPVIARKVIE